MTKTPSPEYLEDHAEAKLDLIALHQWNSKDRFGHLRGKRPRDKDWRKITYDLNQLVKHIRNGGNVGVRLQKTDIVLDVDPRNFKAGDDPLARLQADFGLDLDACPHVLTGGGGHHYYMRKPPHLDISEKVGDYPGIEFKTFGRQVVAAGSLHLGKD